MVSFLSTEPSMNTTVMTTATKFLAGLSPRVKVTISTVLTVGVGLYCLWNM
jgi:hypothetical protein